MTISLLVSDLLTQDQDQQGQPSKITQAGTKCIFSLLRER